MSQRFVLSRFCFWDMTSQCNQTQGINLFDPVIDPDGFITYCGTEWIIRTSMHDFIFYSLHSEWHKWIVAIFQPYHHRHNHHQWGYIWPKVNATLVWNALADCLFCTNESGNMVLLRQWFTTTGWSRGNYPGNLASLRFCTDNIMDYMGSE